MVWPAKPQWQKIRDSKLEQRDRDLARGKEALGKEADVSLRDDLPFLSATAADIVKAITEEKRWTATRVLQAFVRASMRSHEALNNLTEIRYVEALEDATVLDDEFAKTGKPRGPLHGVPISIKDMINIEGRDTTVGATMFVDEPAESDAAVIAILKEAGAIAGYCKTNVPQTMLSFECSNPLFGPTLNPYSHTQVPGGSSGGEAALLASDGSIMGVGSDVGGSLRIPAHYSGCFGLKPVAGRIPMSGAKTLNPGFEAIKSALGPMARSVEDLELLCKVLIQGGKPYWHYEKLVPLPWREQPLPAKLRFGYYEHDNFIMSTPACARAVRESIKALRQAGHEVVELPPPDTVTALEIFISLTSADGYEKLFSHIGDDPIEASLFLLNLGPKLGSLRGRLSSLMGATLDPKLARIFKQGGHRSVKELNEWQYKRDVFVQAVRKDYWHHRALDGIICPVQASPALSLGSTWNLSPLCAHTVYYNVVDTTAGAVPVTFVDPALDLYRPPTDPEAVKALAEQYAGLPMGALYGTRLKAGAYDPMGKMNGCPVGVQVVGPAHAEEKVLGMMRVLDQALGDRGFGPGAFAKRRG